MNAISFIEGISNLKYVSKNISSGKKNMDTSKIEYVIGIDLGHGETSAAICPIPKGVDKYLASAKDIEMSGKRKFIPSAISILPNGNAYIGEAAFNPDILKQAQVHVCFKKRPENINGESEQLMIRFMKEVYNRICENNFGLLNSTNHLVYIATPSGWDKDSQNLYLQMAEAAGIPMGGITKESRAAFVRAQHDATSSLVKKVRKGAVVFDMGSSTLDFTYMSSELPGMIDYGYDCGASFIEKSIYAEKEKENENIQLFEQKHPDLIDYLLFETRKIKERVYDNPSFKVKQSINYDDFVEDKELEDKKISLTFQPGELNQFLSKNGYLSKIINAMEDYIENHIKGHKIYGVFMTGGASRMDFLKDIICRCWNLEPSQVYRDSDPSLTISKGVAEVARMDIQTKGMNEEVEDAIKALTNGNVIFDRFSETMVSTLQENITARVRDVLVAFRDDDDDRTLYGLQRDLHSNIDDITSSILSAAPDTLRQIIEEEIEPIRAKVEAIVAHYSKECVYVQIPEINVGRIELDIHLSSVIESISSIISVRSNNWVKYVLAGAGAIFGLIGASIGYYVGSLFTKKLTEKEKKDKTMSKFLDKEERGKVFNAIADKWENIVSDINTGIENAVNDNPEVKRSIKTAVSKVVNEYKTNLKKARVLID